MNDAVASEYVRLDDFRIINSHSFVRHFDVYHLPVDRLGLHCFHCGCWNFCGYHMIGEDTYQFLLVLMLQQGCNRTFWQSCESFVGRSKDSEWSFTL